MVFPVFTWFRNGPQDGGGVGPIVMGFNENPATAAVALTPDDIQYITEAYAPSAFVTLLLDGTLAAGAAATLPTVADLLAAFNLQGNAGYFGFVLRVINASSANFAWTLTTNTGWTLEAGGTYAVAQNTFSDFLVTVDVDKGVGIINYVGSGTY